MLWDLSDKTSPLWACITWAETPEERANQVGRNANALVKAAPLDERAEITLLGNGAPGWVAAVVVHAVMHAFRAVYWQDSEESPRVLVAFHP